MELWQQLVITFMTSAFASSGLWALFSKFLDKRSNRTKLLIGLAHDRIIYLGLQYIQRGWITEDEYENLHDYLYVPYELNGGNGSAKRIMNEVDKLSIKTVDYRTEAKIIK